MSVEFIQEVHDGICMYDGGGDYYMFLILSSVTAICTTLLLTLHPRKSKWFQLLKQYIILYICNRIVLSPPPLLYIHKLHSTEPLKPLKLDSPLKNENKCLFNVLCWPVCCDQLNCGLVYTHTSFQTVHFHKNIYLWWQFGIRLFNALDTIYL